MPSSADLEGKTGFQVRQSLVNKCDKIGVGVFDPVERGRDRYAKHCASEGGNCEVVAWTLGALGDNVGELADDLRELVEHRRSLGGDYEGQLRPLLLVGQVLVIHRREHRTQPMTDGLDWAKLRWLGAAGFDYERVIVVCEHEVFFGREVAEEGAG